MKTEKQTHNNHDSNSTDNIAADKLLRSAAKDVAAHEARMREIILTLKKAAEGDTDLSIVGERKLRSIAAHFDISTKNKETNTIAAELADKLLDDISRTEPGLCSTLSVVAPPERIQTWKQLDLLPVSSSFEVSSALKQTSDESLNDWQKKMNTTFRLGAAFLLNCTAGSSLATDCLCGTAEHTTTKVYLESLHADTVNIALYEHIPTLAAAVCNATQNKRFTAMANEAGATGIQVYEIRSSDKPSTDTIDNVFRLATTNGVGLALETGAIDVLLADTQKVLPKIASVAAFNKTVIVTTNKSSHLAGAEFIGTGNEVQTLAENIVTRAIESFKNRRDVKRTLPGKDVTAQVGFSLDTIDRHYGCLDRIASALIDGKIKGIVSLFGSTPTDADSTQHLAVLINTLLENNILIFANGYPAFSLAAQGFCSSKAREKCGEMLQLFLNTNMPPVWHFGECTDNAQPLATFREVAKYAGHKMKDLPFAAVIPEWSEAEGLGATLAFRVSGFDTYHCTPPSLQQSKNIQDFLYNGTQDQLGSSMHVAPNPNDLAEMIISDFNNARSELCWR
ncbi:hypothetical protein [Halodesulfovibrio aestuarii]|uniref:hypothetical protein n=1 Tax=Halodesulfovibrio aestuarii TaxID=126333 RepID=UPI000424668F